jgi:hypothetical protein
MMYGGKSQSFCGHYTSLALKTFVLVMTIFPEKQTLAQAELDRVVGPSRLPNMEDQVSLPVSLK